MNNDIYKTLFQKKEKVSVPTKWMINLPETITREVWEWQMICETCLWLWLHQYEENWKQYIWACKNCHWWVADICEHCWKQKIWRIWYTSFHDCEEWKKAFDDYQKKKDEENIEKARKHFEESIKIPLSEYKLDYVFIDDDFVSVDELEDRFEWFSDEDIPFINWAEVFTPRLNSADIVQRIYDEAPEDYELDEVSLQKLLDEWLKNQTKNNTWYIPDESTYIIIR